MKQQLVAELMQQGILVTPELFEAIDKLEPGKTTRQYMQELGLQDSKQAQVQVISSYDKEPMRYKTQNFVRFFTHRFRTLERILRNRQELANVISLHRLSAKGERENVSIIGMVRDVREGRNEKIMIDLEDPTGSATIMIKKENHELYEQAKSLTYDEVIGVHAVVFRKNILFADSIIWPDVPFSKSVKKTHDDVFALFLSDIHVGSNMFLEAAFERFIQWLSGEVGNEAQRAIASRVQYVFICGDVIDGVGIYPGQEKELTICTAAGQYEAFAKYMARLPDHIQVIICPGNHDTVRLEEPQPVIHQKYAQSLYDMPNVTLVSNPSYVTIHESETSEGIDVLLYHGYSYDYYVANIDELRSNGGYNRIDLTMKYLLKRRHLAPTHKSSLYMPHDEDPLVITRLPDIFVSGHVHKSIASNYRNISLICGSCWQDRTAFQEKVGHIPEPGRVPVVNLKTRDIKILKFI